jgi:hypothetical protein
MAKRQDFGNLFLSSGGMILAGAAICFATGTIGAGGLLAAGIASYVALKIVNEIDRNDDTE